MAVVRLDTLRTVGFASITTGYAVIGTAIQHNWRLMHITNSSNGDIFISADGINDNVFVPASSFVLYDISTNSATNQGPTDLVFAKFTQFYIRYSTAPTSGSVYLTGIYAQGE
jgi:hypothetical protein